MIEGMRRVDVTIVYKRTEYGRKCFHLECLKEALIARFETVNQENIARDMHVKVEAAERCSNI